jgi:soluble lytic murein transglycosylase-like protein
VASIADLQAYANTIASQDNLNPTIFSWMLNQESGWNPNAQNGNASGIAQFMPATAQQYGVNTSDPYSSISGAGAYLSNLLSSNNGNYTAALTQYGTLANVPSSVTSSYNNMLTSLGLSPSTATQASAGTSSSANPTVTQTAGAVAESDSFITKIAVVVLGIVLIGGAIMVYHKS